MLVSWKVGRFVEIERLRRVCEDEKRYRIYYIIFI